MDPATIDRIRRSYDHFNAAGIFDEEFFSPDAEWHNAPELPGAEIHRGREAVLADIAAQGEAFEWRRVELVDVLPAGDKVVVLTSLIAQGKASGAPVKIDVAHVWTIEEGLVKKIEAFIDRDAALRSAGLPS